MFFCEINFHDCFLFPKQQGLQLSERIDTNLTGVCYFQNNKDYNSPSFASRIVQAVYYFQNNKDYNCSTSLLPLFSAVYYFQNNKDYNCSGKICHCDDAVYYFQNNKDYNVPASTSSWIMLFLISKTTRITTFPRQCFQKSRCFLFPKQQGLQRTFSNMLCNYAVSYFQNNKDYNIIARRILLRQLFLISKTTRITTQALHQEP